MRRLVCALAVLLALPVGAQAATRQIIRGAGFGHGVGMSQYGAYGFAAHGYSYARILAHYYSGTSLSRAQSQSIRVLLESGGKSATFSGATDVPGHHLDPNKTYKVQLAGLSGEVLRGPDGKQIDSYAVPFQATGKSGLVRLGGRALNGVSGGRYRDALEFRPSPFGGLAVVNVASLDDYVKGVVPGEIPATWPIGVLEAQAVAARSYALATDAGGAVFDQYPDTRSQVYKGADYEQPGSNAAVDATAGQVLRYQGAIAATYFFSTSGGETEDIQNVFYGAQPEPYLTGVKDPYDGVSPRHRWQMVLSSTAVKKRLGSLVKGKFRGIKVLQRGVSPRIVWAQVVGTKGAVNVRGVTLRDKLGLFDTWASFNRFSTHVKPHKPTAPPISPGGGVPGRVAKAFYIPVSRGRPAQLYGSVTPAPKRRLARVQRLERGGAWRTVRRVRIGSSGAYRVSVRGPGRTEWWRVRW